MPASLPPITSRCGTARSVGELEFGDEVTDASGDVVADLPHGEVLSSISGGTEGDGSTWPR